MNSFRSSPLSVLLAGSALALLPGTALAQDRQEPTRVEEVVITGAPYGVAAEATTLALESLSEADLATAPAQTLGDLVSGLPGLRSSGFAPGASRPVIRGLSGPRVQVLTNGLGMIDASSVSPDHQVAVDPAEAVRVDVLRGPSTLVYGGSAIGGVVNIIDERVPVAPADGLDGRITGQASSVDQGQSLAARVIHGGGPWVFTVDGMSRRTDDYAIPSPALSQRLADELGLDRGEGGTLHNSFSQIEQVGAGLSWVNDRGYVGGAVKHTDSWYGVVVEDEVTIRLEQTRYDFRADQDVAWGPFSRARLSVGAAQYEHVEYEGVDAGTRFNSEGVEGRFELIQAERNGWNGAVGVQGLTRTFDAVGDEAYVPRTDIGEFGAYALQRWERGGFGLEGGVRIDRRELETASAARDFTNVSASLGVFVQPMDGLFLGLSVARNERAPTEIELFADGPHIATGAYEVGNPDFGKEAARSLEATAHYSRGPFSGDLHVYSVSYDGFIDSAPTGVFDVDSGLEIFEYVQTNAEFIGFEAEASLDLFRFGAGMLSAELAADAVRGETDLGPPARIPPWSVTGRLLWESERFDGRLEVRTVGEQDRVAANELPTDSYTLVNLYGGWRPVAGADVTLFAEVRNLADEEAREHASFLKDIAPLPGRNIRVGLAYRF